MPQNEVQPRRTKEQIRAEFHRRGISIAEWSRRKGFDRQLVYRVLTESVPCLRGESHRIAVALGLKPGKSDCMEEMDAWLQGEE